MTLMINFSQAVGCTKIVAKVVSVKSWIIKFYLGLGYVDSGRTCDMPDECIKYLKLPTKLHILEKQI